MTKSKSKVEVRVQDPSLVESRLRDEAQMLATELDATKRELREVKTQFEAIYDHHFQLTGLIDAEGRLQMANRTALDLIGAELRDVVGKPFWDAPWWTHSENEQERLKNTMLEAMEGRMGHFKTTHLTREGEARIIDFRIRPVNDENGEVKWLVPEGFDITDMMRVQNELARSEEKYRRLVNNLTEEHFFYRHDRDGVFTYVSPSMTRMLGWESQEFLRHFSKLAADHPANSEVAEKTRLGLQGIRQKPYPIVARCKDGSERWLEITEVPIADESGNVLELEGIAHDFTERKEMEEALQTSQRRLHETMQYARLGRWDLLKNGLTANWSDEIYEIFGIENSSAAGPDTLKKLVHPDDTSLVLESLKDALTQGSEHKVDYRILRPDGTQRWVECRAQPVRNADGKIEKLSGFLQDITDRKQAEVALRRSEERFRAVATATNDLVYEWGVTGDDLHWYGDIDRALGYPPGGFPRTISAWIAAIHPDDRLAIEPEVTRMQAQGGSVEITYRIKTADGMWRTWCDTGQTLENEDGRVITMIGGCKDVTEQRLAEEKIHHLAFHDSLTGLPNRVFFKAEMQKSLEGYRRNKEQFALHYLDLDHFKDINDSLGHHIGDELLRKVATRVSTITRGVDLFARLGGDEFGLIQSGIRDVSQASIFAAKIIQELGREFQLRDRTVHINTSIGIVVPDDSLIDADDLLKKADTALYKAKEAGRGVYAFFHDSMTIRLQREMELVHFLVSAIKGNQFVLEYQPQYDLTDRKVIGLEALIRWNHPERGLLMPGDFLPTAEKRGLIYEISDWALSAACRQAKQWCDNGIEFGRVAVNLCAAQVDSDNFYERTREVLHATGLEPTKLELEFTETVLMQAKDNTKGAIQRLSDLGVKFAIDDFGTGFSSLSYLKNFHADKIKIDQEFVRDVCRDPNDAEIVKATIALGVALGLDTIAEGVENSEQSEFLTRHGCRQAQGFFLGRPLSVDETTEILGRIR